MQSRMDAEEMIKVTHLTKRFAKGSDVAAVVTIRVFGSLAGGRRKVPKGKLRGRTRR